MSIPRTIANLILATVVSCVAGGATAGLLVLPIAALMNRGAPAAAQTLPMAIMFTPIMVTVGGGAGLVMSPIVLLAGGAMWLAGARITALRRLISWVLVVPCLACLVVLRSVFINAPPLDDDGRIWAILFLVGSIVCSTTFRAVMLIRSPPVA